MMACLLVLSPGTERRPLVNPRFYRTHFLTALGLTCLALFQVHDASWPVVTALGAGLALAFLGSVAWSLEGSPGGWALILLTTLALGVGLCLLEAGTALPALLGGLTSAALL